MIRSTSLMKGYLSRGLEVRKKLGFYQIINKNDFRRYDLVLTQMDG